ncbi:hypothetical protein QR680_012304 [Steinernema hermaphroditum]|uniref:Uncharacterized protein n=1 Tax=Steinernema hermaphroditum TaxID=289476 RepID=A0AA39I1L7_9BILA|nr:hypothetical protein QR680_012304 [Steinernema hermaphroditum]
MNDLPAVFYEALFRLSQSTRSPYPFFQYAIPLSGNFGIFARFMHENTCLHAICLDKDRVFGDYLFYWLKDEIRPCDGDPKNDQYISRVAILLFANSKVPREVADHIRNPYASYELMLEQETISRELVDAALSWKQLTLLNIGTMLSDSSIELCEELVRNGNLTQLNLHDWAQTERAVEMIKIALCQDSIRTVWLETADVLEELLAFCSSNLGKVVEGTLDDNHQVYMLFDCAGLGKGEEEEAYLPQTRELRLLFT